MSSILEFHLYSSLASEPQGVRGFGNCWHPGNVEPVWAFLAILRTWEQTITQGFLLQNEGHIGQSVDALSESVVS